jgi:hypothetical protein
MAHQSSGHISYLDFPQPPISAKKAHVVPSLATSSLLSVGQLVDSNSSVVFDKVKVKVLHNHSKVLEGQRNWKMDFLPHNYNNNQTSRNKTMNFPFFKSQIQF